LSIQLVVDLLYGFQDEVDNWSDIHKGKFVPACVMKAFGGRRGMA